MPIGKCENNHRYNQDTHGDTCPICGLVSRKAKEEGKTLEELKAMYELREEQYVCGWLVCVEGINKGREYPIHTGINTIGSGDSMDIQIRGDLHIEEYYHAAIMYDPQAKQTSILPGESKGLAYLEGNLVYLPQELAAYAEIELGETKLLFRPFCGQDFDWQSEGDASKDGI